MGGERITFGMIKCDAVCPLCGAEIKICTNKFHKEMAIEWGRTFGWTIHQRECPGFSMEEFHRHVSIGMVECGQTENNIENEWQT